MSENPVGIRDSVVRALAKLSLVGSVGLLAVLFAGTAGRAATWSQVQPKLSGLSDADPLGVLVIAVVFVAGLVVLGLGAFKAPLGLSRFAAHKSASRHYDDMLID
jgi:hypothetical protein